MASKNSRLDRFISKQLSCNRSDVKGLLAQKRISVNKQLANDVQQMISPFCHVMFDEQCLQNNTAYYFMLNKPKGVVSATRDAKHKTVINVLHESLSEQQVKQLAQNPPLHIVGRLDFNSTGLMLLTNNGSWSKNISSPTQHVPKTYQVALEHEIDDSYIKAFAKGMYFDFEDITTAPATLTISDSHHAEVILTEGRYHQIKRMFGRFDNKVLQLHRSSMGNITLDTQLALGASRALTPNEIALYE